MTSPNAVLAVTVFMTIVMIIFAEVMPKTIAALKPESVALPASHLLKPLSAFIRERLFVRNISNAPNIPMTNMIIPGWDVLGASHTLGTGVVISAGAGVGDGVGVAAPKATTLIVMSAVLLPTDASLA